MARMTNFRSAAIATGNAINASEYDTVKVVSDSIGSVTTVADVITNKGIDFAALAGVLNNLDTITANNLGVLANLDLKSLIDDLNKGNYLGNRKLDIDLSLNIDGITENLIKTDPASAEALWVSNSSAVQYDSATITFVDGTSVELPFLSDGSPSLVTNSAGLLAQFNRTDIVPAQVQEDVVYSITALDSTAYTITIDNVPYTYTTGVGATIGEIVTNFANIINTGTNPYTAYNEITELRIKANVAGNSFLTSVDTNMMIRTDIPNVVAGSYQTEFLDKLNTTTFNSFTTTVIDSVVRFFDVIGQSSNLEKVQLHTSPSATGYIDPNPVFYWAKTTSALETISMRAGDVIKLGNEIDNIVLLANSISQALEIQNRLPELVDTYVDGIPQGDVTIYNKLSELDTIYTELTKIITVYNDIKVGGTNAIQTTASNIADVTAVATDLNLGASSKVIAVGSNIDNVNTTATNNADITTVATNIADVNTTATNITNINSVSSVVSNINTLATDIANVDIASTNISDINSVVTNVVPNMPEVLQAATNAATATTQAGIATTKADEITAITGTQNAVTLAAGSSSTAYYDSVSGKFTFGIPQGPKGDKGDSFTVNAVGNTGDKSLYDTQTTGFSFLDITTSNIYFKLSSTSGDWSTGAPFGKGDTGNGISSIAFSSTTDGSGNAGVAGAVDTYTITFTDATVSTFDITNGSIPTKVSLGLDLVDNTADVDKPISIAQQTALNLKADLASPTFTGTVSGITSSMVGLANVDNTSDVNKPISLDTQTALNLKAPQATTYTKAEVDAALAGISSKPTQAQLMAYSI